mgnify:CR=1 FL=1|jgi:hypothetical protein|tara:strand:+ start:188 stop:457 length:270 start_codon:yes stop_codon:yes gene_type:complete
MEQAPDNILNQNYVKRIYSSLKVAGYISLIALSGCMTMPKTTLYDINKDGKPDIIHRDDKYILLWRQGEGEPFKLNDILEVIGTEPLHF